MFSGREDIVRQLYTNLHVKFNEIPSSLDGRFKPETLTMFEGVLDCFETIADLAFVPPISAVAKIGKFGVKIIEKRNEKKRKELNNIYSQRDKLKKQLGAQNVKLIIIIDNIDRLTGSEIRSMFQAIKSVSDFPNVLYILAYDQKIVEEALDFEFRQNYTSSPDSGRDYLKKIVQLSIAIPDTTPYLKRYSEEKLFSVDKNLTLEKIQSRPKLERRWNALYQNSLSTIFKNPRDVIRLYNVMVLVSSTHDSTLDYMDLLSIQIIRDYEPKLYNIIRKNPKYFSNKAYNFSNCDYSINGAVLDDFEYSSEQMRKEFLQPIISSYKSKLHIIYLLCDLFPLIHPTVKHVLPFYEGISSDFTRPGKYRAVNCINAATGIRIQESEFAFLRYFGCNIELSDKQLDTLLQVRYFPDPADFVLLFNHFESGKPPEGRLLLNRILSQIRNYDTGSGNLPNSSVRNIMSGVLSLDFTSFNLSAHNKKQFHSLLESARDIVVDLLKIDPKEVAVLRLSEEIQYTTNIVLLSMIMDKIFINVSNSNNWDLRSEYFSKSENIESLKVAQDKLQEAWEYVFNTFITDNLLSLLLPNFEYVYRASRINAHTAAKLDRLLTYLWSDKTMLVRFIHRAVTDGYLTEDNRGLLLNYNIGQTEIADIIHPLLMDHRYSTERHSLNVYLTILEKNPEIHGA